MIISRQPSAISRQKSEMLNANWYILGPCSAESREQVMETARQLKNACGSFPFIFRAGIWKPRTSPNTFQGVGEEGLAWLREVKEQFGVPVATEVVTPEHVRMALEAGIDYLWIGARSSANPIVIQSIADEIQRFKDLKIQKFKDSNLHNYSLKAVLIKNPVNADGRLWIGNIERLEKTGVPVIAVHRGCNHAPCWSMAHEVRLARPDIPMLLDPSHMSGDAKKVPELMKKVEELGLDGAMVEVHNNPSAALSDATQQLTPEGLTATLIDRYADRPASPDRPQTKSADRFELNWLRAEMDELDERLWETIDERMEVSRKIGEWKKANGVAPLQPERYQEIVERLKARGERQEARG